MKVWNHPCAVLSCRQVQIGGSWFVTTSAVRIADEDNQCSSPENTISHDGYPKVHGDKISEENHHECLTRVGYRTKKDHMKIRSELSFQTNQRSQHTGIAVLLVRDIGWRGARNDKLIVDEFLDLEYKDIEEASLASTFLENTCSS